MQKLLFECIECGKQVEVEVEGVDGWKVEANPFGFCPECRELDEAENGSL